MAKSTKGSRRHGKEDNKVIANHSAVSCAGRTNWLNGCKGKPADTSRKWE